MWPRSKARRLSLGDSNEIMRNVMAERVMGMPKDSKPADVREIGRKALDATSSWFPYPFDPEATTPGHLALAGLARCRRLLHGMLTLHDDAPDLVGGFARSHFEVWVWSIFLLLDGEEAMEYLRAN